MNFIDILIAIVLIFCALLGFKRGVFKSIIILVGFIAVIYISYLLKNYLGDFFVLNLPFIRFGNLFASLQSLNILMYQTLAFIIMLIIFGLVYRFIITITGVFEKILRLTIVLGIPSKLLGLVVGFIEGYVIVYLGLFILTQPFIKNDFLSDSKYANKILNNSPVISDFAESSLQLFNEVTEITKIENKELMEEQIVKLMLDKKVVTKEVMQKIVEKGKIEGETIRKIVDNYQ